MTADNELAEEDIRFPDIFSWPPDGLWLYIISAFLILFIWLVYPLAFIAGIILLALWLSA